MTAMDPEFDEDRGEFTHRRIFGAPWFVVTLSVIAVLALVAAIALPYFLDRASRAPGAPAALKSPAAPSLRPSPPPPPEPVVISSKESAVTEGPGKPSQVAAKPAREPERAVRRRGAEPLTRQIKEAEAPVVRARETQTDKKQVREENEATAAGTRGGYMVQVGAFQDAGNANRLAAQLARQKYPVQRATVTQPGAAAGSGGHEIVVVGASLDEITGKLQGTTRKALATREGVLIQPALPLKEAVSLSQEFRAEGLTVKIRRAQGAATLHVVRVGAYPNRSRAEAVRKELQEKGFNAYVVQGRPGER